MEISSAENEAIVRTVCESVSSALEKGQAVKPEHLVVYEIDYLVMEANSAASYEQYFRWASVEQIGRIISALRMVRLEDVADLTERAIRVAFPHGVPTSNEEKTNLTNWSDEQENELRALFTLFEEHNGRITNVLARYVTMSGQGK